LHAFHDEVRQLGAKALPGSPAAVVPRGRIAPAPRRRALLAALRSNLDRRAYDVMLARAREHILAGDIYQANLSHRFESACGGDGVALYRRLRSINPSPFATYMRFPEHQLVSCSPERLVRLRSGRVETRPIAGTRPRGSTSLEDDLLERELLASEKERAEHLMIVDMARNDIGRVCELGSVRVDRFMSVERYSHVRHLVSNVVGSLRPNRDALDVLAAVFPGASITGVPKIRCMQIIDELEQFRRGVYTGSAGYFGLDGDMDLNILIRTFFLQNGHAYFNVGGGIVADSHAESEYHETLAKGRALLEALSTSGVERPRGFRRPIAPVYGEAAARSRASEV
jgi:anthranilate/para-aminobenzoate synthase component I